MALNEDMVLIHAQIRRRQPYGISLDHLTDKKQRDDERDMAAVISFIDGNSVSLTALVNNGYLEV